MDERRRRHANLLQMGKMKQMGTKFTREFTIEDSSEEMQFEIDYQENNTAVVNAVSMMKGGLGLAFTGLEMGNAKLGPFLNLTGLSASACSDMSRYNAPLEKIYRRFFRKREMNPIQELLFLVGGTVLLTHFGNKGGPMIKALLSMFLGGGGFASAASPSPPPDTTAFSQRGYDPRNIPVSSPPSAPPTALTTPPERPASRKPLRPPGHHHYPAPSAASVSLAPASLAPAPVPLPASVAPARPDRSRNSAAAAIIFPLAGTPLRRGNPDTHMSLPTVIEEIDTSTTAEPADLDRATFERLMREVVAEEEDNHKDAAS